MKMLLVCLLTAFSVTYIRAAMAAFERPCGHVFEDFAFARGQRRDRLIGRAAAEQLRNDLGIHRRPAAGDLPHRVDELVDVEDAVLEQVSDPAGPVGEQFACVELLDVLRQDEHGQAGYLGAGLDRGAQPLVGERRRQPHVDHGDVGPLGDQSPQQGRAVVDRLDDLEVVGFEQADQPVPEEGEVFGEDGAETGAHGSTIASLVGPPGGLSSSRLPSKAASRRWIPRKPVPAPGSAPPMPSSVTVSCNCSPVTPSSIVALVAPLCLITFVRASATRNTPLIPAAPTAVRRSNR